MRFVSWNVNGLRAAIRKGIDAYFEELNADVVMLQETLYAYGISNVLFKPTLAAVEQFRPTFDQALSYFVASNDACPEDKGFAIKGWTKVRFENSETILHETMALAMGNYFFTSPEGDEVKVEYTFGYVRDDAGAVRINVHHSSMPATPDA